MLLPVFALDAVFAQSAAFTYNSQLSYHGALANGNFDLEFTIYDSEVGGQVVKGPQPVNNLPVVNGSVTVRLDFGAGVFTGPARWLQTAIRPAGQGSLTPLIPRQEVTSSPYSIRAQTAATAADFVAGAAVKSINGLKDDLTLAAGANVTITPNGNTLTIGSSGTGGSGLWSANANDAYYTGGNVGIGTNKPSAGVSLEVNGIVRAEPGGSGGFFQVGTPAGETGLGVIGANRFDLRFDGSSVKLVAGLGPGAPPPDNGLAIDTAGDVSVGRDLSFGFKARQMLNLYGEGFGIGIQTANLYNRSAAGFAWHVGGVHNDATYNSGGGTTVMTLDLEGLKFGGRLGQQLWLWSDPGNTRYFGMGVQDSTLYSRCGGGGADGFAWYKGGIHNNSYHNGGGGQLLMSLDSSGLSVATLTIRGGADLAEPFELSKKDIAKGSVVIIDPENEGKLKLSDRAYDQRVAGVVSGANGVNPGISLRQEGVLEGGQNVALSGRVYVLADATDDPIKPGDLLTTSDTPGHAMKVSDHGKAQGAILGKAMTGLKEGKGLVLVLVTLQ